MEENEFKENLNNLAKNFFENHPPLKSRDELDQFLDSLNLLEIWSSDEEKDMFWESLIKYQNNNEINYESAIKGLHDFLNQDEDEGENDNNEINTGTTRISRISRMSYAFNNQSKKPHHRREITRIFTRIEDQKLFQIQKIFNLLNLNNGVTHISIEEIENLINNRLTTLTKEEIVNYFVEICDTTAEEKIDVDTITDFSINENLFIRAKVAIEKQIGSNNYMNFNKPIDEIKENENSDDEDDDDQPYYNNYNIESNPLDYIINLIKNQEINNDKLSLMTNIKNSIRRSNENLSSSLFKLNGEVNIEPILNIQNLLKEQVKEYEKTLKELKKNEREKIENLELLKSGIIKLNSELERMEEENKILQEESTNQRLNIEEEMEKLINDNIILQRDKEDIQKELEEISKENFENLNNFELERVKNNQLQNQILEMTSTINRLKFEKEEEKKKYNDYVQILDQMVSEKKKQDKNEQEVLEEQVAQNIINEINEKKESENIFPNETYEIKEKKVKESSKKLGQMSYDKLLSYSVQVDISNQSLLDEVENLKNEKKKFEQNEISFKNLQSEFNQLSINFRSLEKKLSIANSEIKRLKKNEKDRIEKNMSDGRASLAGMREPQKIDKKQLQKKSSFQTVNIKDVLAQKGTKKVNNTTNNKLEKKNDNKKKEFSGIKGKNKIIANTPLMKVNEVNEEDYTDSGTMKISSAVNLFDKRDSNVIGVENNDNLKKMNNNINEFNVENCKEENTNEKKVNNVVFKDNSSENEKNTFMGEKSNNDNINSNIVNNNTEININNTSMDNNKVKGVIPETKIENINNEIKSNLLKTDNEIQIGNEKNMEIQSQINAEIKNNNNIEIQLNNNQNISEFKQENQKENNLEFQSNNQNKKELEFNAEFQNTNNLEIKGENHFENNIDLKIDSQNNNLEFNPEIQNKNNNEFTLEKQKNNIQIESQINDNMEYKTEIDKNTNFEFQSQQNNKNIEFKPENRNNIQINSQNIKNITEFKPEIQNNNNLEFNSQTNNNNTQFNPEIQNNTNIQIQSTLKNNVNEFKPEIQNNNNLEFNSQINNNNTQFNSEKESNNNLEKKSEIKEEKNIIINNNENNLILEGEKKPELQSQNRDSKTLESKNPEKNTVELSKKNLNISPKKNEYKSPKKNTESSKKNLKNEKYENSEQKGNENNEEEEEGQFDMDNLDFAGDNLNENEEETNVNVDNFDENVEIRVSTMNFIAESNLINTNNINKEKMSIKKDDNIENKIENISNPDSEQNNFINISNPELDLNENDIESNKNSKDANLKISISNDIENENIQNKGDNNNKLQITNKQNNIINQNKNNNPINITKSNLKEENMNHISSKSVLNNNMFNIEEISNQKKEKPINSHLKMETNIEIFDKKYNDMFDNDTKIVISNKNFFSNKKPNTTKENKKINFKGDYDFDEKMNYFYDEIKQNEVNDNAKTLKELLGNNSNDEEEKEDLENNNNINKINFTLTKKEDLKFEKKNENMNDNSKKNTHLIRTQTEVLDSKPIQKFKNEFNNNNPIINFNQNLFNNNKENNNINNNDVIENNDNNKNSSIKTPLNQKMGLLFKSKTMKTDDNSNYSKSKESLSSINSLKKSVNKIINYDFCGVIKDNRIFNLFPSGDKPKNEEVFSDIIYHFVDGKKEEKNIIVMTPKIIFLVDLKNYLKKKEYKTEHIQQILIPKKNTSVIIFFFKENHEDGLLMATVRRMEVLYYIRSFIRPKVKISYKYPKEGETIIMTINGKLMNCQIPTNSKLNFDGAIKVGYLLKKRNYFFGKFVEKLAVLTSIGLLLFEEESKRPTRMIPIIGSAFQQNIGYHVYSRHNVFSITTSSNEKYILSAFSETEKAQWFKAFQDVQKDYDQKMKGIDTKNNAVIEEDIEEDKGYD